MAKTVIFLNGELSNFDSARSYLKAATLFLAADGGARHAITHDIALHYILGDMDSITPEVLSHFESSGTKIVRYPVDKDYTDLELCLNFAKEQGSKEIHLLGVEGGRSDHLLNTLTVFGHSEFSSLKLWAYDATHRMTSVQSGQSITLEAKPGSRLSLLPITPTVEQVDMNGTRWELKDATLKLGRSLTVSNEVIGNRVEVRIGEGIVVVVLER